MVFGASIMLMKNTASFRPSACVPVMHVAFIAAGECWEFGTRRLNGRHKDALLSVQSSISKEPKQNWEQALSNPYRLAGDTDRSSVGQRVGFKEMLKPAGT